MLALIRKELQLEWRTRETLASLLLLGLLTLLVLGFALDPGSPARAEAAPGALWTSVTFASVLGLNRSFVVERDNDCLYGLLLCPVDRGSIYLAKTVANVLFMLAAQAVLLPLFVFFFNPPAGARLGGVVLSLVLGTLGLAAVGTLFAAIAVRTRAREVLLPLLMVPLVVPLFIAGVRITARALAGRPLADVLHWIHLMIGFDVVFVVVGWMAFEYVVEE